MKKEMFKMERRKRKIMEEAKEIKMLRTTN